MSDVTALVPERFYNYVTAGTTPSSPTEGETWFDTSADESKVYDGAGWNVVNVTAHGDLSGVGASDHHSRYTDSEAANAAPVQSVNGKTGSVTVQTATPASWVRDYSVSALTAINSNTWSFGANIAISYVDINVGGYGHGEVELRLDDGSKWTWGGGDTGSGGGAGTTRHYIPKLDGRLLDELYIQHEDDGDVSSSSTTVRLAGVST